MRIVGPWEVWPVSTLCRHCFVFGLGLFLLHGLLCYDQAAGGIGALTSTGCEKPRESSSSELPLAAAR